MAYCTTSDVKQYLGVSSTTDDTLIGDLIPRAQQSIDSYCHRTFEATGDTTRYFDADRDTDGPMLYFDADIAAITTVTNGDGTTVASTKYVTEPRNSTPYCAIQLKVSSGLQWEYDSNSDPENAIVVTGRWAWSTSVPDDIVHACIRLTAYFYRQKDAQVFDTTATPELGTITIPQGLPKDVTRLLNPYRSLV